MALTRKDIESIIGDKIEDKETLNKIVNEIVTKYNDTLQAVVGENTQLKADLTKANSDLTTMQKTAVDVDKVQKKLDELQEKYDTDTAELHGQISKRDTDKIIDSHIANLKGRDPGVIKKLLDMELINNSKDKNKEAEKQISALSKEKAFLFITTEESTKNISTGGNASGTANGLTQEQFNKMSYSDRVNLYNTDKATYEKLKGD